MRRRYWWGLGILITGVLFAVGVHIVRTPEFSADYVSEDQQEELEAGLTLRDVVLEQQDDDGDLLWRVNADEVTYSPDQESANLVRVEGELFQDGELLYRVKSDRGVIRENGQVIFLEQNIVANGIQNQMVIKGETLEWRPEEDVMVVRENLTGSHPQVRAQAGEARVYNREQRMEFKEEVIASTVVPNPETDPWFKLQADTLEWRWALEEIGSDQSLRIERLQDNRVTELLTGQEGLFELAENRATVTNDVDVLLTEIPLIAESDEAIWNINEETIQVDRPVRIVNQEEKVTLTAQRGQIDTSEQIVYLTQDVVVEAAENESRMTANRLAWNLNDQTVLAEGAVNYQQQRDPQVTLSGPRARGRIEEQTIVVDGGRVVTEIVPDIE